jgi:hypothetical protein
VYNNHQIFRASLRLIAVFEIDAMPPLVSADSDIRYQGCVRELPLRLQNAVGVSPALRIHSPIPKLVPLSGIVQPPIDRQTYMEESKTEEDDLIWNVGKRVFGESNTEAGIHYLNSVEDVVLFKKDVFDYASSVTSSNILSTDLMEWNKDSIYFPPAWILTNLRTGHRTEIANPFYERAKDLRNIQPNLMYLYLHLRRNNTINGYLTTFPVYYEKFVMLEREYENFITEVHNAYVKFYILKIRDNTIPKKYFVHAARIHHDIYLPSISTVRIKITRSVVNVYFIHFSIAKVIYFMEAEN